MITVHARPRWTDVQTDARMDEHHGNSAMIRSIKRVVCLEQLKTLLFCSAYGT